MRLEVRQVRSLSTAAVVAHVHHGLMLDLVDGPNLTTLPHLTERTVCPHTEGDDVLLAAILGLRPPTALSRMKESLMSRR